MNNASIVGVVLAGALLTVSLVADGVDGPPLGSVTQLSSGSGTVAVADYQVIDTITDAEYCIPAPAVAYLRISMIDPTLPPTITRSSVGPPR